MDENEVLLREHEELIKLFIHEDTLAWNLIYFFLVINVGMISGIGALVSLGVTSTTLLVVSFLCMFGAFISVSWSFTLRRNRVHRESRLFRAEDIEKELHKKGLTFDTFQTAEVAIFYKKMKYKRNGKYEPLGRSETIEPLQYFPNVTFSIGIIWLFLSILLLAFVLQIQFPIDC